MSKNYKIYREDLEMYKEFKLCKSQYIISDKSDSAEISSDGEFIDANHINDLDEDDSYINEIENTRE